MCNFFKILLFIIFAVNSQSCAAALRVDVSGGNFNPIPIYIAKIASSTELGDNITNVVSGDLKTSALFNIIGKSEVINLDHSPVFIKFKALGADYIVGGKVSSKLDKQITIEFYAWNVHTGQKVLARRIYGDLRGWRQLAHMVADAIYSGLTGEKPYFTSKLLFIDETGPVDKRIKKLAIMDQDGANVAYLTNGEQLAITPKFAPDRQSVVYTVYINDSPHSCLQELKTGARAILEQSSNGTIAPSFSPDGKSVIMAKLRDNGNASLFSLDVEKVMQSLKAAGPRTMLLHGEGYMHQLTDGNNIDAASSFSPDGKQIVFASDSSGQQKLYLINADGTGKTQISRGSGSYSTPVWAPRGDYIAFTKREHGQFSIGICRIDGSEERLFDTNFHSERPCWAPNGRSLVFFKENAMGHPKLYALDIITGEERQILTPHDASDPDWSFKL
ncbi:Tol-Pal system protein TolB [Bartonella sp. TP]|uniref:Tol-Pal system protein TolB n=1 Tax=Bartonella sp. TP TaxID=3057550 RepID=UPI0025AF66C9|nr:Tol-Pal system protein TolB [Bartonella sp. TP]MDN5248730.1 Tol-Pal system protein TolB [Alphaproteobacteria bacterium]WJW79636.1 Tol-Pal system protein TolB [Bartonella sp. TP]